MAPKRRSPSFPRPRVIPKDPCEYRELVESQGQLTFEILDKALEGSCERLEAIEQTARGVLETMEEVEGPPALSEELSSTIKSELASAALELEKDWGKEQAWRSGVVSAGAAFDTLIPSRKLETILEEENERLESPGHRNARDLARCTDTPSIRARQLKRILPTYGEVRAVLEHEGLIPANSPTELVIALCHGGV